MSPLTYDRMVIRIESLIDQVPVELSGDESIQRRAEILAALNAYLATTRAGLQGEEGVQTPAQLKHGLQEKINEIHERFGHEKLVPKLTLKLKLASGSSGVSASGASAPKKNEIAENVAATMKRVLRSTNSGVKKTPKAVVKSPTKKPAKAPVKKTVKTVQTVSGSSSSTTTPSLTSSLQTQDVTTEDRQMAILLMQLPKVAPRAPATFFRRGIQVQRNTSVAPAFPSITLLDSNIRPQVHFLAGVQYALQCFSANPALNDSPACTAQLLSHVQRELDIMQPPKTSFKTSSELDAAASMIAFAKQPTVTSQPTHASPPVQANAANSFWNVI